MDTSDPGIRFFDGGVCNHCTNFLHRKATLPKGEKRESACQQIIQEIRQNGKGKKYDCIIGVSGGRDSTYVAYIVKKLELRPLAVHLDNGWDSELAVHNIQKTLKNLDIDLVTEVLDWDSFKKIQLAFLHSSTPDLELPTDHAIRTTLLRLARRHRIHYILNGRNYSTEGILPIDWSYGPFDWKYMRAVHKRFMGRRIRNFHHLSLGKYLWYTMVYRTNDVNILNLVEYEKESATAILVNELGWTDYGDKHYESVWTRFFQGYILPRKFGYDKRRAHLSVLILNGKISREEGLELLKDDTYMREMAEDDKEYVAKKFDLTISEFDKLMARPNKSFRDYPNDSKIFRPRENSQTLRALRIAAALRIVPPTFGKNLLEHRNNSA